MGDIERITSSGAFAPGTHTSSVTLTLWNSTGTPVLLDDVAGTNGTVAEAGGKIG